MTLGAQEPALIARVVMGSIVRAQQVDRQPPPSGVFLAAAA